MCSFKLVKTPIDLEATYIDWCLEHAIDYSKVIEIVNAPTEFDYYPRLICFHLRSKADRHKVFVESLSVNEVRRLILIEQEIQSF